MISTMLSNASRTASTEPTCRYRSRDKVTSRDLGKVSCYRDYLFAYDCALNICNEHEMQLGNDMSYRKPARTLASPKKYEEG
ncbi:hypothetical protein RRG08_022771 [Elysia crispata]|uniref:Uncharacterized protein n=1 Tax=Elysia crispata TaxID=231223 RepID=A0AAE0ZX79_9GAST|nr:hypothetical protein RRG08_022771 [Elysia crispata]